MSMSGPKLVIFDCDGTLVDSQHLIVDVMTRTFRQFGYAAPHHSDSRAIIGLSLTDAMATLKPDLDHAGHVKLARAFEENFRILRADPAHEFEPLYPGIKELLRRLDKAGYLMAVATGKSMRGLRNVLAEHEIGSYFISLQTADHHPSKPHPSMVQTCLADSGAAPRDAIVVGDTTFDMTMARSAGCFALGVDWGYHDREALLHSGAEQVADRAEDILKAVKTLIGPEPKSLRR